MRLEIFHVQWVDSQAIGEWQDLEEIDHDLGVIHTVGMLVHQDSDCLFIASSYDGNREAVNAAIWIPKSCVRELTLLSSIDI